MKPERVKDLTRLVYMDRLPDGRPDYATWKYRERRTEILRVGFETKLPGVWRASNNADALPRVTVGIEFDYDGFRFAVRPYVQGAPQGSARFFVECPACGKWCSVGKYMLHAPIHDKDVAPVANPE